MIRDTYLRDTVTLYDTEMFVTVEPTDVFVDGDTQIVGRRNYYGKPTGYGRQDTVPQDVQYCEAIVAHIRPTNNRAAVSDEWPENAPTTKRVYDLLEQPVRRRWLPFLWTTESCDRSTTDRELAEAVVTGLKNDAEAAPRVKSLDRNAESSAV